MKRERIKKIYLGHGETLRLRAKQSGIPTLVVDDVMMKNKRAYFTDEVSTVLLAGGSLTMDADFLYGVYKIKVEPVSAERLALTAERKPPRGPTAPAPCQ